MEGEEIARHVLRVYSIFFVSLRMVGRRFLPCCLIGREGFFHVLYYVSSKLPDNPRSVRVDETPAIPSCEGLAGGEGYVAEWVLRSSTAS